ncbi:MAG TPA: universal stress protein [Nitrososphaeraceae archaeon]|nr:universal stress protein [Nitrososphaeraceae archaeon]
MEDQQQRSDNKISKILVAIDGSEHSIKAADLALEMAKKESISAQKIGNELTALTVLDVSKPRKFLSSFIAAPTYGLRELEEERNAAKHWMDAVRKKAEERKIPFRSEIIEGLVSAEATIVDYAESHQIDLIVVGTRGRTGFSKVLLGSVASRVVEYAHCSVVVVK